MLLLNGWFSSQPQLIDRTEGSFDESAITALRQSISPFSSKVEK
jgi:hypothetical protein